MPESETGVIDPEENINILVAEDEEYNYLFLSEMFSGYNVTMTRAYNGKMAVDTCMENDRLHLVLMDVRMPVMDGYEAAKKIKKIRPALPVIAQTAFAMESDRKRAINEGFDDYITKPVKSDLLFDLINKYVPAPHPLKRIK
ncbi:MAG: response regulator [Prolixibacteraceae bacterium]